MITDERLMSNYLAGSVSAFEELYRRHRRRVYEIALKHTEDPPHTEQIIQLVFKRFHKTRRRFDPKYSVVHHLFVITRYEIIQFLKRTHRYRAEDWQDPIPVPSATSLPEDFRQEVRRQLDSLTDESMTHLSVRFQDGLAFEEIAANLGIPWSPT